MRPTVYYRNQIIQAAVGERWQWNDMKSSFHAWVSTRWKIGSNKDGIQHPLFKSCTGKPRVEPTSCRIRLRGTNHL
jgi:hypothetical protein